MLKFNNFKHKDILQENVQQAKVFLKNKALRDKKTLLGDTGEPVTLTPDEVRAAERNPNFLKIKEMCERGMGAGYTYLFTKIFFEDMKGDTDRLQELQEFHDYVKSFGNVLSGLPTELVNYTRPTSETSKSTYERLTDDLERLKIDRKTKMFVDKLLPKQKEWVERATKQQKRTLDEVANGFTQMGLDEDDNFDPVLNKTLQRGFFSKIADYTSLDQITDGAKATIKAASNGFLGKFLKKIAKVNDQLGEVNGADIVYNKDGYLVIEVFTFVANRELNAHTSHCITRSIGHWDTYLKDFNKQYYVYNFNIDPSANDSVIGMTIQPDGKVSASHLKDDENCLSRFKSIIEAWNIPFSVFKPMSTEEMEAKRKRIQASKVIIQDGISVEQAKTALGDGADPNAKGGLPLRNAVKSDNFELATLLISKGAIVNLGDDESQRAISHTRSFEMLKMLVEKGASVTQGVFRNVKDDIDAVRFLLEAGMDPSFEQSYPFRMAAKVGNVEMMKLILEFADNVPEEKLSVAEKRESLIIARRYMAVKLAAEEGKVESISFIMDQLRDCKSKIFQSQETLDEFIKALINWCSTSHRFDKGQLEEFTRVLQSYKSINESGRFLNFGQFVRAI